MTEATPPAASADTGAPATPASAAPAAPSAPATPAPAAPPSPEPAPPAVPVPSPTPPAPEPAPAAKPEAKDGLKIPDAYKDKGWMTKYKFESIDDVFKVLDEAQSALGKKMIVPDLSKATDAEREDYFKQTRPASVDEYQFGEMIDPTLKAGIADSLMKNGVSAVQANAIIKDYQAGEQALLAQQFSPDGMKEAMKTAFGDNWEQITGQSRNALKGVISEEDFKMLDNLPNVYIGLMYRAMGNVVQKYGIKETGAHTGADQGTPAPTDIAGVREGIRNEIRGLSMKPHTAEQKQALINKLNDTFKPKV